MPNIHPWMKTPTIKSVKQSLFQNCLKRIQVAQYKVQQNGWQEPPLSIVWSGSDLHDTLMITFHNKPNLDAFGGTVWTNIISHFEVKFPSNCIKKQLSILTFTVSNYNLLIKSLFLTTYINDTCVHASVIKWWRHLWDKKWTFDTESVLQLD